jgi:hypothetical protein
MLHRVCYTETGQTDPQLGPWAAVDAPPPFTCQTLTCLLFLPATPCCSLMSDSDSDVSSQPEPDDLDSSEDAVDERGKRSKQQQARPRKQRNTSGLGGTRRVGASGKQRSVGKYGAGMLEERPDCWGPLCKGPHKASVQATDAELEECLATKHQMEGRDLQQHITDVNCE